MDANAWLGAGSLIVALIAVTVAIGARRDAANAHTVAKQANSIARKANTHADDANKIAVASNEIAKDATSYAKYVPTDLAWDQVIVGLLAIQTADVVGPEEDELPSKITSVKTAIMLLNDRVATHDFADWTFREMQLGMLHAYQARSLGAAFKKQFDNREFFDINELMELNDPFRKWVSAFLINLRLYRRGEIDASQLVDLTNLAKREAAGISDECGLGEPPETIPGLSPLYPEDPDPDS